MTSKKLTNIAIHHHQLPTTNKIFINEHLKTKPKNDRKVEKTTEILKKNRKRLG
ncbi:MAG: hypothetical protein MR536_09405 [Prevotella sp.]|nr:hypothetical protein [Prevotella sp.]MDY3851380.1 hypothetical protein [Prevotella sp.]